MNKTFQWTPARLTSVSFLSIIILGTILLALPGATQGESAASFIDAMFTAVSAVCVTGLIVQDTPTFFSLFGQIVILVLIQIGGLGIMTLSASLPVLFGKKMKMSQRDLFLGILDQSDYVDLKQTLRNIIRYTFIIETIGAIFLTLRFYSYWHDFKKALYYGVFHSISAFCNAGFALFSDNLVGFREDPVINITIMALIVSGGLGFVVLYQILNRKSFKDYSVHAKFVLILTAALIILPSIIIFFTEYSSGLMDYSVREKLEISVFHVVSARTAGFNLVDLNILGDSTLFIIIMLMFIGGAPGGTAGGVKVTTVGLMHLSIRTLLAGRDQIELFGRRIPEGLVMKATAIMAVSFGLVTATIILLLMFEEAPFKEIFFETVSAFGTVGLSLGLTSKLSVVGKFIISVVMFVGRVGPLALVFLIGSQTQKVYYRYPEGKIMVG